MSQRRTVSNEWLDIFGRPVFPMLLFIAAESFHYTRSKKKYLMRLLFASWIMTIFTTLLGSMVPNKNIVLMNNALCVQHLFCVRLVYAVLGLACGGHTE